MKHALRYHLKVHLEEDPVFYQSLSDRLEEILEQLGERWDEIEIQLRQLLEEARQGRQDDLFGLDLRAEAPFFAVLLEEMREVRDIAREEPAIVAERVQELVDYVGQTISVTGFWRNSVRSEQLHGWIVQFLDRHNLVPLNRIEKVADRLIELARANHSKLVDR